MRPDFYSVLLQIDRFIEPIYNAVLKEEEFFGTGLASKNKCQ